MDRGASYFNRYRKNTSLYVLMEADKENNVIGLLSSPKSNRSSDCRPTWYADAVIRATTNCLIRWTAALSAPGIRLGFCLPEFALNT